MLSLVLPTYNESANLDALFGEVHDALKGIDYEVIVVDDDSPDKTWEKAEKLTDAVSDLRVIRRIGRRGLSSAVVEGLRAAKGTVCAVMDADGQHDPRLLRDMLRAVEDGADLVIGSRYMTGGGVGNWNIFRKLLSASGTLLTRMSIRRNVRDPLSGFFMVKRTAIEPIIKGFHPQGFKILLDLLIRIPKAATVRELPFIFRTRHAGESKLSFGVHLAVLRTLLPLLLERVSIWVFVSICLALTVALGVRVVALLPLYTHASIREQVRHDMEALTMQRGWLLSDLSLQSVNDRGATLLHREHRRGRDPVTCLRDDFSLHTWQLCDAF